MACPLASVNFAGRIRRFALVLLGEKVFPVLLHRSNRRAWGKCGAWRGNVAKSVITLLSGFSGIKRSFGVCPAKRLMDAACECPRRRLTEKAVRPFSTVNQLFFNNFSTIYQRLSAVIIAQCTIGTRPFLVVFSTFSRQFSFSSAFFWSARGQCTIGTMTGIGTELGELG
jgi:hypothetical protein